MEPGRPGRRARISRQTVNAIETERFDPSLPLAFKIAAVFDQTIEAIFLADPDTGADTQNA